MTGVPLTIQRWTAVVACLLAGGVAPAPAGAQTIVVRVQSAETRGALAGALAHLMTPEGESLTARLSDDGGRVAFANVAPGRYVVRAEMIGHATARSEPFEVRAEGAPPLVLRLETRAIALAGVEVTAEGGRCEMRPGGEGKLLAAVWEEARKALSVAEATDAQGIYRYALTLYDRQLDTDLAVVDDQLRRRQGNMRAPFESIDVDELAERGFVRKSTEGWTYFAPDAEALLSDRFLDTHCFRLAQASDRPELVGLAFEPTAANSSLPDISGTLWLDRDSVQLRFLEYTYENLEPDVRPGEATGWVRFQRMPAGTWIVPEWWIRMPLVELDTSRSDRRRRITGYREAGGRVDDVLDARVAGLGAGSRTGTIVGTVVDSSGAPMQGVRVSTLGSSQEIFSDAQGRFALARLDEGTYRVRFLHATLDSLGLVPPTVTQQVVAGVTAEVAYSMPSAVDLLRASCPSDASERVAVLGGVVRDEATGAPIPGASVRVTWSTLDVRGAGAGSTGRETRAGYETTTDGSGFYRFCQLPLREGLTIATSFVGVSGIEEAVAIPEDVAVLVHVIRYRP